MSYVKNILVLCCVVTCGVFAKAVPIDNAIEDNEILSSATMSQCAENKGITGVVNCAAMRAIKSMQSMSNQPIIEVLPGVTFSSDPKHLLRVGKEISQDALPIDPKERMYALFDLLVETTARLFAGRTLKLELTNETKESLARSFDEGKKKGKKKGKMKKMMMPMLLGIGSKMLSLIPIALGGVALLTTKALIVAKVALVLAVIAFVMNMGSGGFRIPSFSGWGTNSIGHDYGAPAPTYGVNSYYPTNSVGGNYRRSLDVAATENKELKTAQDVAYWNQKQQ